MTDTDSRHPPHHRDLRRRAAEHRLLHPHPRAAAGEADGELRRSRHLPSLFRRRRPGGRAASSPSSPSPWQHRARAAAGWSIPPPSSSPPTRSRTGSSGSRGTASSPNRARRALRPAVHRLRRPGRTEARACRGRGLRWRGRSSASQARPSRASTPTARSACSPTAWATPWRARATAGSGWSPTATCRGATLDVLTGPSEGRARPGAGTVHHIAFRVAANAAQEAWRERIVGLGYDVTPVIDRQYFRSIYFRERGGILFEIATDPPGFAVDEAPERFGTGLMLPSIYERDRSTIEKSLPPVRLPGGEEVGG